MSPAKPNFFLVGAPRCGTSAMHRYLDAHPDIFMPWVKEPHFFCTDLNEERDRSGGVHRMRWPVQTLDQYLFLFREAGAESVIGESSVLYLYSETAAREIAAFNPDARILIMLREPVAFLHSLHSVFVFLGDEDCLSFPRALELEESRSRGVGLPSVARMPSLLMYSRFARFTEQIRRFQEQFPPEQIKIVIFDDFRSRTAEVYSEVLAHLGVRDTGVPPDPETPRNANRAPRSARLSLWMRALHPHMVSMVKDPAFPRHPDFRPPFATRILPRKACMLLHRAIEKFNSKVAPRSPLGDEERARIMVRFRDEVASLGELLGRDLTALWGYDELP